jgi:hypothetical protein
MRENHQTLKVKNAQISLGICQSYSNCHSVQIIPEFYKTNYQKFYFYWASCEHTKHTVLLKVKI